MEKDYYAHYAATEDSYWWFVARRAILRRLLSHWLPPSPGRRILDIGCGTGAMLELLQTFGQVEGLDFSPQALDHCRRRIGTTVELHEGAFPDYLPVGRLYDVITAFDVLEHLANPAVALRRMRRALVSKGMLFCTVPAFQFLWGPHDDVNHHFRRYVRSQLTKDLEDAGYKVHWCSYFNTVLFFPIAASRVWNKLSRRESATASSDIVPVSAFLNATLRNMFSLEQLVIPRFSFPFGVSLVAIAQADG
jgi:SAM-dependent methyltransferase